MACFRNHPTHDGYIERNIHVSVSRRTAVRLPRNERRCNETSVTGALLIGRHPTLGVGVNNAPSNRFFCWRQTCKEMLMPTMIEEGRHFEEGIENWSARSFPSLFIGLVCRRCMRSVLLPFEIWTVKFDSFHLCQCFTHKTLLLVHCCIS